MFKEYKYLLTTLAMAGFNLCAFFYSTNQLLAITFMSIGACLLIAKAIVLKRNGENLLVQYMQWLAELTAFSGVAGLGFLNQNMLVGVVMLVTTIVGLVAYIFIVLCREMSKNK